jgi:hypothetical protein
MLFFFSIIHDNKTRRETFWKVLQIQTENNRYIENKLLNSHVKQFLFLYFHFQKSNPSK